MIKEIELIDAFCAWLTKIGYPYKREVRKGSYHNEGYCDVVIKDKNDIFVGIEAKTSSFSTLVRQVHGNWCCYHWNYALFPRIPKNVDLLKNCGLIIPADQVMSSFKIVRKTRLDHWHWSNMRYGRMKGRTLRNWEENRVGRKIHAAELPEDYDAAYLESTYDWRRDV